MLTPISTVGLSLSMVATRSLEGGVLWAYTFCSGDKSAREGSSSPLTSNIETRPRAASSDKPFNSMAATIRLAIPMPAEPAPRNRMRCSVSGLSMICSAVVSPASVTLAVP